VGIFKKSTFDPFHPNSLLEGRGNFCADLITRNYEPASDKISNPRVVVVHRVGIGGVIQTRSAHRVPNEKISLVRYPLLIDTVLGIPLTMEICRHSLDRHAAQAQMSDLHTGRLLLLQEVK
jgi:hypothetical protein